jgi:hypothetical protein
VLDLDLGQLWSTLIYTTVLARPTLIGSFERRVAQYRRS